MPTDNYFADAEPASKPETPPAKESSEDSQTAVLPKSMCKEGCQPGDELKLRVVRLHDDSVEVACCDDSEDEDESEDETETAPMPSGSDNEMGSMME